MTVKELIAELEKLDPEMKVESRVWIDRSPGDCDGTDVNYRMG